MKLYVLYLFSCFFLFLVYFNFCVKSVFLTKPWFFCLGPRRPFGRSGLLRVKSGLARPSRNSHRTCVAFGGLVSRNSPGLPGTRRKTRLEPHRNNMFLQYLTMENPSVAAGPRFWYVFQYFEKSVFVIWFRVCLHVFLWILYKFKVCSQNLCENELNI